MKNARRRVNEEKKSSNVKMMLKNRPLGADYVSASIARQRWDWQAEHPSSTSLT